MRSTSKCFRKQTGYVLLEDMPSCSRDFLGPGQQDGPQNPQVDVCVGFSFSSVMFCGLMWYFLAFYAHSMCLHFLSYQRNELTSPQIGIQLMKIKILRRTNIRPVEWTPLACLRRCHTGHDITLGRRGRLRKVPGRTWSHSSHIGSKGRSRADKGPPLVFSGRAMESPFRT